jgi:hypothetical protein
MEALEQLAEPKPRHDLTREEEKKESSRYTNEGILNVCEDLEDSCASRG